MSPFAKEVFWLPRCFSHNHRTIPEFLVMAAFLVLAVCVVNNKEEELFATDVSVHTMNKTLKQVYVLKFFFSLSLMHFKDIGHNI